MRFYLIFLLMVIIAFAKCQAAQDCEPNKCNSDCANRGVLGLKSKLSLCKIRPKKDLFDEFPDRNKNYVKFMEWQDDDDDRKSICSLSWSGKNFLGRSKSESSINVIEGCNYRTQGTQVSLKSCNTAKNVTSILENFNLRNNDSDDIIDDDVPTMIIDYPTYNQFDCGYQYGIKTKDVTTKAIVMQKPEILNFQGNRHMPDEIAPYWKKDCRMWLWKSVRLTHKKNQISVVFISKN